jgi:sodium/hydrogen exchanger-like protein 6/7
MFGSFVGLSFTSLAVGIAFGLSVSWLLKRFYSLNSAQQCTLLFAGAYLSYLVSECLHFSGIITLFCCGFTIAHYGFYSMSDNCRNGSTLAVETLSHISEGFLFVYLGMSSLSIKWVDVKFSLILILTIGIAISRFLSVFSGLLLLSIF